MFDIKTIENLITEVAINKNYNYLIENYSFEERKQFIFDESIIFDANFEKSFTDEQIAIFVSYILTPEEAKELTKAKTKYEINDSTDLAFFSLSDQDKIKILETLYYDDYDTEALIYSIKDEKLKITYKKRTDNIQEYIEHMTLEEKKELIKHYEHLNNKIIIIESIESETERYEAIIKNNITDFSTILKLITDSNLLINLFFNNNIYPTIYELEEFLKKLSKEDILKIITSNKFKEFYSQDVILNLDYEKLKEVVDDERFIISDSLLFTMKYQDLDEKNKYIYEKALKTKTISINSVIRRINDDNFKLNIYKNYDLKLEEKIYLINSLPDETIFDNITLFLKDFDITKIINCMEKPNIILKLLTKEYFDEKKRLEKIIFIKNLLDDESKYYAINNPDINYDINESEKLEIVLTISSEEIKKKIIYSNIFNVETKAEIIASLSDEEKIKIIEKNSFGYDNFDLSALISTIKSAKYDNYKYQKVCIFNENNHLFKSNIFLDIVSSIQNQELIKKILSDKKIDNEGKKLYLSRYLKKLPIDFVLELIKEMIITEAFKNDRISYEDLISQICNIDEDIGYKFYKEIEPLLDINFKCSYLLNLKKEKYDSIKIDFLENNYQDLLYRPSIITNLTKGIKSQEILINFYDKVLNNIEDTNTKIAFIKSIGQENIVLRYLIELNDFTQVSNFINHCENINDIKDNIKLIIIYSKNYNIEFEKLKELTDFFGYSVLRIIENENVMNLLKQDDVTFNKIFNIFKIQGMLVPSEEHIDNVLNAIIQRKFRNENIEIINIFERIKYNLNTNNLIKVKCDLINIYEYLRLTSKDFIEELLLENKLDNFSKFVNNISVKDLKIINKLTNKYIMEKRNSYVNDKIEIYKERLHLEKTYEKNTLIKSFFTNNDLVRIKYIIESIDNELLTSEEIDLINNKEILELCIKFKKGEEVNKDIIRNYIKTFSIIIDKLYREKMLDFAKTSDVNTIYYIKVNKENLANILMDLDIDSIKEKLISNEELYKEFLNILKTYRMMGWNDTFSDLAELADMEIDNSTIAALINNFYIIYPNIIKKLEYDNQYLEKKRKVSLSSILDEAEAYGSDSLKYKKLIGKENYKFIRKNPTPQAASGKKEERLLLCIEKVKGMFQRKYVTVPPLKKEIKLDEDKQINISISESTEMMNLTYGERTGACMRINGHAASLFDFCLLNENGFHIKLTDENNELISRVSGFRNGNTIFLNQLRLSLKEKYSSEDLIKALKEFSSLLIESTKDSTYPIENVLISNTLATSDEKTESIECDDIRTGYPNFYFSDFNKDSVVVLATKEPNKITPIKLGVDKCEKYHCGREDILLIEQYNKDLIIEKIDKIHLINDLLIGIPLKDSIIYSVRNSNILVNINKFYCGQDWYLILDKDNNILEEFIIESVNKEHAINELKKIKSQIKKGIKQS